MTQAKEAQTTEPKKDLEDKDLIKISDKENPDAKWYVVHTYSGHEQKVAITLKQRVESFGFQDRICQVLVPTHEKIVINEGKKRKVDEHIFPGYILVNMVMADDTWHAVRSTTGVTGFVGMGTTPTPLPDAEVKNIMKFMRMEAPKFEAKFRVGDSVKVVDGPFRDILGKVDEVNEEQGKVKVLISVFGREVPTELDFLQVTPL
ncbi:MAG: transcription termination/antitermination protein NusG [Patescibacteria group bacterium]